MSNPESPDVSTLTTALAEAQASAAHWWRLLAAVVRANGPVLVHPGDYASVDPNGLEDVPVDVPGYPDQARMFFLPEHLRAMVGGMMAAMSQSLPDGFELPHPDTFPGQQPDQSPDEQESGNG